MDEMKFKIGEKVKFSDGIKEGYGIVDSYSLEDERLPYIVSHGKRFTLFSEYDLISCEP